MLRGQNSLILSVALILMVSCGKDVARPSSMVVVSIGDSKNPAFPFGQHPKLSLETDIIVTFNLKISPDFHAYSVNLMEPSNDGTGGLRMVGSKVSFQDHVLTINPDDTLKTGVLYTIRFYEPLNSEERIPFRDTTLTFGTIGHPVPDLKQLRIFGGLLAYFSFSGKVKDETYNHSPAVSDIRDITFVKDRYGDEGMAAGFNGTSSIIEIPNGQDFLSSKGFTMMLWVTASSTKNGQFVFGLAGEKGFEFELAEDWSYTKFVTQYINSDSLMISDENIYTADGLTKDNGGWQGTTVNVDLRSSGGVAKFFKDAWCMVTFTYDPATKLARMYINTIKVKEQNFNLWPVGDPKRIIVKAKYAGNLTGGGNKLALGFIQGSENRIISDVWADPSIASNRHFKGAIDDFIFFDHPLTEVQVYTMYSLVGYPRP